MSSKGKMAKKKHHFKAEKYTQNHLTKLLFQPKKNLRFLFSIFAKKISDLVGNAFMFILALLTVIVWAALGHYFHYSDTWQLIINTGTTIVTFLMVFLIQNTQNRDTEILNLKIDELIKANRSADNEVINLAELSDSELKQLENEYKKIKNKRTGE